MHENISKNLNTCLHLRVIKCRYNTLSLNKGITPYTANQYAADAVNVKLMQVTNVNPRLSARFQVYKTFGCTIFNSESTKIFCLRQ